MKKQFVLLILFLFFSLHAYSVEIKYILLNGTNGIINVPEDIIEINAFKGNMNFIRVNGEKINLTTVSPMTEINGLENLLNLKRLELSLQLHCDDISFLKSNSLEYLLINMGVKIRNMDFLNNLPNEPVSK